jgi:hypothetical protein
MSESNDKPEGLDDFIKQVFGGTEEAQEFASSMEANQMVEAWKGIYEVYTGLRSGGFTFSQANGVMGAYLFHLISGIEGGL